VFDFMRRHPDWLKVRIGGGERYRQMISLLRKAKLHTICQEAKCPNIAECFNSGTAVFLIMGDICTRNCRYCNVSHGTPEPLNPDEPRDVAESVKELKLKYAVITSVTRDDLTDGGASVFSNTITSIKKINPDCKVEVLTPDFNGDIKSIRTVLRAKPDVFNHNIEVVKQLFSNIRPEGNYSRSLNLLESIKKIDKQTKTKSGFMIGLGETKNQIIATMKDLRTAKVDFLTIGQYLQPSRNHVEIQRYYTPDEFKVFKEIAINIGFNHVESGPLVRSSYHAEKAII
jgi:lipoic acid synthetase